MSRTIPRRRSRLALLTAPVLALAVGCGSSGTTTSTSASNQPASQSSSQAATYPVTVQGSNGSVTINAQPKRIVSLSAAETEILWSIGADKQVVAVDDQSNYPQGVPTTKLSSYKPNAEAIAGYNPDLVVLSDDQNGIVGALAKLKIPTLLLNAPQTLDDSYTQFTTLGRATGHEAEATKEAQTVKERIAAAVASVPKATKPLSVYHELEQDYYSATSKTFIGSIYSLFGLKNIADAAKGADSGYPQLSAEYVVQQAPDLIVLADTKCCGQTPQTVAKRPAFGTIPAVKDGKIVAADDDIVSRWGPRTADFAELVAKELNGQ
ncbi:MAG TPA: ABC transporter substrate-binding protein [Kineosporiaceae bacterium]|nr:ABC transporter substrate-binding protein [Kineosporiaceae bacterium]